MKSLKNKVLNKFACDRFKKKFLRLNQMSCALCLNTRLVPLL